MSNLVHIAKMEAHLVKLEDRLMLPDENIKDTINTKVKQVQCNCNMYRVNKIDVFLTYFLLTCGFFSVFEETEKLLYIFCTL